MKRNIPRLTLDDIITTLSSEFPTKIVVTSEHELIIHTGIKLDPDITRRTTAKHQGKPNDHPWDTRR